MTAIGFFILERTDAGSINDPVDFFGRPIDGVVMEVLLRVAERIIDGTIEGGGVSLAEVVGLRVSGVTTHQFPIYLVQVVGLEHYTADDALSGGGLHYHLDGAEEDVEV